MPELTGPLVVKDAERRIVYGPVLVPDEPDSDGDVVSAERIETVAHKFVENYSNIDLQHSLKNVGHLVESAVLPVDWPVSEDVMVPKGSWIMGVRVTDDDTWEAAKSGELSGFSIMALNTATKSAAAQAGTALKGANHRVTLADLDDGWEVAAVSLVDMPAVPKAKWTAIKSAGSPVLQSNPVEGHLPDGAENDMEQGEDGRATKAVAGSYEERVQAVSRAVHQRFDGFNRWASVYSLLEDSVVFSVFSEDSEDLYYPTMYRVAYSYNDASDQVTFTSDPEEVIVREEVYPVTETVAKADGAVKAATDDPLAGVSLVGRMLEASGFKASRAISDANYKRLKAAKTAIDDLLKVAEEERSSKSAGAVKNTEGDGAVDHDEVQQMINDAVSPIADRVEDAFKNAGSPAAEGNPSSADSAAAEGNSDGDAAAKSAAGADGDDDDKPSYDELASDLASRDEAIKSLTEQLNSRVPFSNRLAGQDVPAVSGKSADDNADQRDAFGFKIEA